MDEWQVGDPADWGDSVGVPDIPYMGYLQDDEEEENDHPRRVSKYDSLRIKAWKLREAGRLEEALDTINEALDCGGNWRCHNVKAIILEDMGQYEHALMSYDRALRNARPQLVLDNKARLLERMARSGKYSKEKSLEYINLALNLTKDGSDRNYFLRTKMNILESMGRPREAYVCNKLANGQYDLVDEFERQSKTLKNSHFTLICITGTRFYDKTSTGSVVDLIKEPENQYDRDAIRVEMNGNTVGYVANSPRTLIKETKSATDIKNRFESRTRAKILFIFMERYTVAKLI